MNYQEIISENFNQHQEVTKKTLLNQKNKIENAGLISANCLKKNGTIFWCGNGGSAADSQHFAAELIGRFKKNRIPLKSIALTTDTSILTCISNDMHFDDIFSRQIQALGNKGDLLVAISTSGKSKNVLNAIKMATQKGLKIIFLTGFKTQLKGISNCEIISIESNDTARIQEMHNLICHIMCEIIEMELGFA